MFDGDGRGLNEGALLEGVEGDIERRLGVLLGGKSTFRGLAAPTGGVMADVDDVGPGFSPAIDMSPHEASFGPGRAEAGTQVLEGGSLSFLLIGRASNPSGGVPTSKVRPGSNTSNELLSCGGDAGRPG